MENIIKHKTTKQQKVSFIKNETYNLKLINDTFLINKGLILILLIIGS